MRLLLILAGAYAAIHSAHMLKTEAARASEVIEIATHNPNELSNL